jgi:hypothetical protein
VIPEELIVEDSLQRDEYPGDSSPVGITKQPIIQYKKTPKKQTPIKKRRSIVKK